MPGVANDPVVLRVDQIDESNLGGDASSEHLTAAERALIEYANLPPDIIVMLHGESGADTDHWAGLLHNLSPRRDNQFAAHNCAELPAGAAESRLLAEIQLAAGERSFWTSSWSCPKTSRSGFFHSADRIGEGAGRRRLRATRA